MAKTIRPGTALKVLYEGRIRHVIVEAVEDQDNILVRLGLNNDPTEFYAVPETWTVTRGELFVDDEARNLLNTAVFYIDSLRPEG